LGYEIRPFAEMRMRVLLLGGVARDAPLEADKAELARIGRVVGRSLAEAGHELVACSPFEDSFDYHAIDAASEFARVATMHYPNDPAVAAAVDRLAAKQPRLKIQRRAHATPDDATPDALRNAWLLSQLEAMNESDVIVAIGGRLGGSASLLLRLADARQRLTLPFMILGGAAEAAFNRSFYELKDAVGDEGVATLSSRDRLAGVGHLVDRRTTIATSTTGRERVVFISYPRARPADADFIEALLRRRNVVVLRDEHSFGEDDEVPHAIRENIHRATLFVATWCAEYACSPHCYDELELAMARHREGKLAIWLFRLDDTRIVPPSAREILHHTARTRVELEAHVRRLLEKL
jgi:hypothetical protein